MTSTGSRAKRRSASRARFASVYRIEAEDLGRKVYRSLRSMIINGDLRSGEKLVQDELAEQLGVSRTPLQLAISKLEQENLVESLPRRGACVRSYTRKELIDIYDIRCRLEPLAARNAALSATPEAIGRLERTNDAFDAAIAVGDPLLLKRTDYAFHMELLQCCGNNFLYGMLATYNIIVISNTQGLLKPAEVSGREHHALIDAIRAHDPETAEHVMFEHILGGRVSLQDERNAGVLSDLSIDAQTSV